MATTLRVAVGQLHLPVGDLEGNHERIVEAMDWAEDEGADVLLLPELAVTGYPPEDLLLAGGFVEENQAIVRRLAARARDVVTIVGFVDRIEALPGDDSTPRGLANAVAFLWQGQVRGRYHKVLLPNYGVFDERRYFAPGRVRGGTWTLHGVAAGVLVCEDLWRPDIPDAQAVDGAQVLLVSNASPYHIGKIDARESIVVDTARRCGTPVAYVNLVGGQDEIVFDGASLAVDARGNVLARAPLFEPARFVVDLEPAHPVLDPAHPEGSPRRSRFVCRPAPRARHQPATSPPLAEPGEDVAQVYRALVRATSDFVTAHGYEHAVVGLSGGVDSSLVATIATDALGPARVWAVTLPAASSPPDAAEDAAALAGRLGIRHDIVEIDDFVGQAAKLLAGLSGDGADDDLLPRARGALLLALASRCRGVVLPTGNKTESALGFGTLGGDVAGGFAMLRDVPKTLVYALSRWRSGTDGRDYGWAAGPGVVPDRVLTKAPSAERVPDRPDRQLPAPYAVVDAILGRFLELGAAPSDIAAEGHDADVVDRVVELVERNEPLRRQMPPGVKVTARAFGRDRRMPLAHGYDHGGRQRGPRPPAGPWIQG